MEMTGYVTSPWGTKDPLLGTSAKGHEYSRFWRSMRYYCLIWSKKDRPNPQPPPRIFHAFVMENNLLTEIRSDTPLRLACQEIWIVIEQTTLISAYANKNHAKVRQNKTHLRSSMVRKKNGYIIYFWRKGYQCPWSYSKTVLFYACLLGSVLASPLSYFSTHTWTLGDRSQCKLWIKAQKGWRMM